MPPSGTARACPSYLCGGYRSVTCGEEVDTQALLCTGLDAGPKQIISWFVSSWQMEATFQEVRQRLEAPLRRC